VAAMPTPRAELAAVVALDGKIYTIGGMAAGNASGVVEVYDPGTDSWTTRAAMPTRRYGLAAALGSDGQIYAVGGNYTDVSHAGPSIVAEAYDPTTNTWTSLPSLPVGRTYLAVAASGDTIYALGGYDGTTGNFLGSVATLQVGGASWSTLPDPMTTAREYHAAVTMPDGRIYTLGGLHTYTGDELAAFEYTEPGTPGWNTLVPMPTARKDLAAVAIGPLLYAISGSRYLIANQPYTRVLEVYDTSAPSWSQVTSMPSGRYGHAAVSLDGKIYVLGGRREAEDATTAVVDVFTP
ncbi:MAG: kelch repeat-containing protein, partial [Kofleriaceae bacterium]